MGQILSCFTPNKKNRQVKAVAERVSEPVAEQVAEPGAEPVAEPVAQPVSQPVAQPVAEPVAEPNPEPVGEPVAEPVDDHLNYPILKDDDTIAFILKSKVAVVLRGLSGSGKSHIASKLLERYGKDAVECSADLFFVQPDGQYVFDSTKLKDAHASCADAVKQAMSVTHHALVIINNTNIKNWEYKRYLALAKEHHYTVVLLEPQTPWAWDPVALAQKNLHGLEEEALRNKVSQYQASQPVYYGWFLNPVDSVTLVEEAWAWLRRITGHPRLKEALARYCRQAAPQHADGPYYRQCGQDGSFQPLHCTAKFTNRGKAPGAKEYCSNPHVSNNVGRANSVLVTGFVVTPRTIGARVLLTDEQLQLWGQDDDEDISSIAGNSRSEDQQSIVNLDTLFDDASTLRPDVPSNKDGSCGKGTLKSISFEEAGCLIGGGGSVNSLHPVRGCGRGRRAHITVAVAPDVKAVTTGYDLMRLLPKEQQALERLESGYSSSFSSTVTTAKISSDDNSLVNKVGFTGRESTTVTSSNASKDATAQSTVSINVDPKDLNDQSPPVVVDVGGQGRVADYGEGLFVVYPQQVMHLQALFSAYY